MSSKVKNYIYLIYGIIESALLIVAGIALIAACISVYQIGDRPFTPESISAAFSHVRIPVFSALISTVAGLIFSLIFPDENDKIKSIIDKKTSARKLLLRIDPESCADELKLIKRERKLRAVCRTAATVVCIIATIPALIFAQNKENFSIIELEDCVTSLLMHSLPFIILVILSFIVLFFIERASIDRQIKISKSAILRSPNYRSEANDLLFRKEKKNKALVIAARLSIIVVAIIFVVIGIFNGGMADVLSKAVNICTECIGLA